MREHTFGRKKANSSDVSQPSLVSPTTPTLANPVRGFGLLTNNTIQTATEIQIDTQETSLEQKIIQDKPRGHDISRISFVRPQAKLTVGEPGDKYEQEADIMARRVMAMPDTAIKRQISPLVQRETILQQEEELQTKTALQRASNDTLEVGDSIESPLNSSKGRGSPLADTVRNFMEPRFGTDFSSVRVHTDSTAVQMNQELGAQAFTHGNDVYFGGGKTPGNNELTAHELTHVIQQIGGNNFDHPTTSNKLDGAETNLQNHLLRQRDDAVIELAPENLIQRDDEPSTDVDGVARQKAQQVYDALDGWNNVDNALGALQGHSQAMRSRISDQFQFHIHPSGMALRTYLKDQLDGNDLVRAIALLHGSHYHDLHVAMALAIIPLGTRNAEIFRILNSLPLAGRQRLEQQYDDTFYDTYGSGVRTLKQDLKDELGDSDEGQKSLALLYHDLTSAEQLYFDSVAISGTHTESVIQRIQSEWSRGAAAFTNFEADWNNYVRGAGAWNDNRPWTDMTLPQAMRDELGGEDWDLVKAVLDGYERYQQGGGTAADATGELSEDQRFEREEIEIQVAEDTLTAATTGGYIEAGTNEAQVFQAVSTIRRIWQQRIERARQAEDHERRQRYERQWEERRTALIQFIPSEMDTGTADNQRVMLLLAGDLTPADEVYLAGQSGDDNQVISLITRFWAQGQINQLLEQARTARSDDNNHVLRPSFDVTFLVPVTSGITASRLYTLTRRDLDDAGRGALRLKVELDEGDSDSDLQKGYTLLSTNGIDSSLRDRVIQRFANDYLSETEGDTPVRKFLNYIQRRYENSTTCWNFRDLLDATTDPHELVSRAEGRMAASQTGLLDTVLGGFVAVYDSSSGEDTQDVAQESLERLRFIASQFDTNPSELQAMLVMTGATSVEALAGMEYSVFQARLEELRQLKQTIAEAIATVVEIVIETAITIATGGAGAGALLASLSAAVAGMILREAFLGQDYDLVSQQNVQRLVTTIASHGFNSIGRGVFNDVISPERLQQLGRAGGFLEGVATEAFTQVNLQIITAGFERRMPTAESIGASALAIVGNSLGAGGRGALAHGVSQQDLISSRLRRLAAASIVQNVIGGVSEESGAILQSGTGDLTGVDIALRFGRRTAESVGRGLAGAIGEVGGQDVTSAREARREQGLAETDTIPTPTTTPTHPPETTTPVESSPIRPVHPEGESGTDASPALTHSSAARPPEAEGSSYRGQARTMTHEAMLDIFTQATRRPGPGEEVFRVYPSREAYDESYRNLSGDELGHLPQGFVAGGVIHLPPDANTLTVLHESLHWASEQSGARAILGAFVEEGITEALARRIGGPEAGQVYESNVAFVRELAEVVGQRTLDQAFLHRQWGSLRSTLLSHFGSHTRVQEFYQLLRRIGPNGTPAEAVEQARRMLHRMSADQTLPDFALPDGLADSTSARPPSSSSASPEPVAMPTLSRSQSDRLNRLLRSMQNFDISPESVGISNQHTLLESDLAVFLTSHPSIDQALTTLEQAIIRQQDIQGVRAAEELRGGVDRGESELSEEVVPEQRRPTTGEWEGTPGNSNWTPGDPNVWADINYGHIPYRNGYPDFSNFVHLGRAMGEVLIPRNRFYGFDRDAHFRICNEIFARRMGWTHPDGTGIIARSEAYCSANRLTWHHVEHSTILQLVPRSIHEAAQHAGGIATAGH
ncbi:MAG TPA: DUF4157 domain-containing protein [Leptolyngbyaceae cyanobacterium]